MTPPSHLGSIGQLLIEAGRLSRQQVEAALQRQSGTVDTSLIGEILVQEGAISQWELLDFLFRQLTREREEYRNNPTFTPAIRFVDVEKVLDGRRVLKGVSLAIPKGKITAIIGVSGGGKSVTLKHMIGLMRPDRGEVWVGDRVLSGLSRKELVAVRSRFSMLFQGSALFDSLNVFDNVAFPLREMTRLPEADIRSRVEKALCQVNLDGMGDKFPDDLSGGMMKRTALARAMVTLPEIILLDEPTAGLDPIIENSIHHLICDTYMRSRYTMVVITHAVPEIFNWCHHAVVLHEGAILEAGPSLEVLHSKHPVIQQLINGALTGPIKVI
ncbi:MAG: ATP-binding cassette domain-containing protein [Magnetococcales bacterium]|nr:ATP-binding cassette domain-containing protein [Magnetococcales bacterium]